MHLNAQAWATHFESFISLTFFLITHTIFLLIWPQITNLNEIEIKISVAFYFFFHFIFNPSINTYIFNFSLNSIYWFLLLLYFLLLFMVAYWFVYVVFISILFVCCCWCCKIVLYFNNISIYNICFLYIYTIFRFLCLLCWFLLLSLTHLHFYQFNFFFFFFRNSNLLHYFSCVCVYSVITINIWPDRRRDFQIKENSFQRRFIRNLSQNHV